MNLFVIRTIPGRTRFGFDSRTVPDLDGFLKIRGVKEVTLNKVTNSLLVAYDEKTLSFKKLLSQIKKKIPKAQISVSKDLVSQEIENPSEPTQLAQLIHNTSSQIDKTFTKGTKNQADITSIVTLVTFLWGVEELVRRPVMPKWYDILRMTQSMFYHTSSQHGEKMVRV